MKPPPFLLGAALIFWGWQSGFLIVGAVMAVVLESARFIKVRWDLSDEDFTRIWTLCSVLVLAMIAFAFTNSGGADSFRGLLDNPSLAAQRSAGNTVSRTANSVVRWLPMTFFLFIAAQTYSSRDRIPLATISLILQRRWKRAKKLNQPLPVSPGMNVSYPYFAICLTAASVHAGGNTQFFWGLCALLAWALWVQRSRRFGPVTWTVALSVAIVLGYYGQFGIGQLQQLIENSGSNLFSYFSRRGFDPTQSRTQLGKIGEVKTSSRIVIRLEPKNGSRAPAYLREASYRAFRSPVWTTGGSKDPFEAITPGPTDTTWSLLLGKTTTATNQIACYLEDRTRNDNIPTGLLPLPSGSARLENLPAYGLQKNTLGAVLAEGPGLVIFDAISGEGETIDSPPGTNDVDSLPDIEAAALDEVISSLKLGDKSVDQKLHTIQAYFQNEFDYSTWQSLGKPFSTNDTPLSRFLLQTRHGHCEYFATATVLLLRRAGIPARYAVGYAVHETSGSGYVVRQSDAHAWCLVWRDNHWEDFDTTPASWVEIEKRRSPFQLVSDAWSRLKFEISKLRWGQTNLQRYLFYLLAPVLVFLIYQIIFRRRWRRLQRKEGGDPLPLNWPGLDSEFYQLEHELTQRGVIRLPGETLGDWLERAATDPALSDINQTLRTLLTLHYRHRFDPAGLDERERDILKHETRACLSKLERQSMETEARS